MSLKAWILLANHGKILTFVSDDHRVGMPQTFALSNNERYRPRKKPVLSLHFQAIPKHIMQMRAKSIVPHSEACDVGSIHRSLHDECAQLKSRQPFPLFVSNLDG